MKLRSLAPPLTSCCVARFLTGLGPTRGLGTPALEHSSLENKFECQRPLGFRSELFISRPHNSCLVKKTIQNFNETEITSLRFQTVFFQNSFILFQFPVIHSSVCSAIKYLLNAFDGLVIT